MIDDQDLLARRQQVIEHYKALAPDLPVNLAPDEEADAVDESFYYASQWQLMWWRFRRHRMALISGALLICLYLIAIFADFIAPYGATTRFRGFQQAPPAIIHFTDANGLRAPYVYGRAREVDPDTRRRTVVENPDETYPIQFLCAWRAVQNVGHFRYGYSSVRPGTEGG